MTACLPVVVIACSPIARSCCQEFMPVLFPDDVAITVFVFEPPTGCVRLNQNCFTG
jgi:hypothetical protein